MKAKEERLKRLFNDATGNSIMIPIDHGLIKGVLEGIEDPVKAVKKFIELKVDAILMNFGILKLTDFLFEDLESPPGRLMGIDFNQLGYEWQIPPRGDVFLGHCVSATVEQAIKYNADAVKVFFALGLEHKLELDCYRNICKIVSECDKYDMPIMIEPTTDGQCISEDKKDDPEITADGCRIALELGADILKISYPKNKDALAAIVENSHVPILIRGGPKTGALSSILQITKDSVDAGAKGTIMGRYVWQRPEEEMERVVKALQDIVHNNADANKTAAKYSLA